MIRRLTTWYYNRFGSCRPVPYGPTKMQRWLKKTFYPLTHMRADDKQAFLVLLSLVLMLNWWFGLPK